MAPAMLGGKPALAVDGSVPLPPVPMLDSGSDDPEEAFEIAVPVPAGASVVRPSNGNGNGNDSGNGIDDGDDDDDHFSNVTLNRAVSTLISPELSSETGLLSAHAAAAGTSGSSAGFKVKIRKPKLKA